MQNEYNNENPIIIIEEDWPLNTIQIVDFFTMVQIFLFSCLLVLLFLFFIVLNIYGEVYDFYMFPCLFNLTYSFIFILCLLLNLLNF